MTTLLVSAFNFVAGLVTKAVSNLMAFFLGRAYERARNAKKETKRIKASAGLSDDALSSKLRERAANKNKDKR